MKVHTTGERNIAIGTNVWMTPMQVQHHWVL